MSGTTLIDLFSKKTEAHDLNVKYAGELRLICFEGEHEYRKNAKETDLINGSIIQLFHDTERSFFRNVVFLAKQQNPKLTHFIIRKKDL